MPEILLCVVLGVVALPFFLIACLIVVVSVGTPLMFSQPRCGRGGQIFRLFKLRSMSAARGSDGALLPDDQRQTKATALIRRLRLDEIPQLLLILRGHMALVGPRPLLPETIESFGTEGQYRCSVRPGLTGWAQVSGNTNLSNTEKLGLDLWYVAHRSTMLDLRIMAETIGVAIWGEHRRIDRIEAAARWLQDHPPPKTSLQGSPA
ncbi:sugar transferase [uncultured Ruegeria sp.]|uniref:sugar transferase n=1 Tax=uncultured Ruegeria sp. TaxID=259304 RepID=UPI00262E0EA3|nr:sugar transferase [uncultured Ruegeria sp.]